MFHRHPRRLHGWRRLASEALGFTLLELSVAMFIAAIALSMAVPSSVRALSNQRLIGTAELLVEQMRYAQEAGQTQDKYGWVRMDLYDPRYTVWIAGRQIDTTQFAPGVNYTDGYLQLETGSLMYDDAGNAQLGGVVRLTDGFSEQDIHLYIGCGLQVLGRGRE